MGTTPYSASETSARLTDDDKTWLAEQIGQAVTCLAYAHSVQLGEATADNLDGLPENQRLGVRFKMQSTYEAEHD